MAVSLVKQAKTVTFGGRLGKLVNEFVSQDLAVPRDITVNRRACTAGIPDELQPKRRARSCQTDHHLRQQPEPEQSDKKSVEPREVLGSCPRAMGEGNEGSTQAGRPPLTTPQQPPCVGCCDGPHWKKAHAHPKLSWPSR